MLKISNGRFIWIMAYRRLHEGRKCNSLYNVLRENWENSNKFVSILQMDVSKESNVSKNFPTENLVESWMNVSLIYIFVVKKSGILQSVKTDFTLIMIVFLRLWLCSSIYKDQANIYEMFQNRPMEILPPFEQFPYDREYLREIYFSEF